MARKGLVNNRSQFVIEKIAFVNEPDRDCQERLIGQNVRKTLQDLAKLGGSKRKAAFFRLDLLTF